MKLIHTKEKGGNMGLLTFILSFMFGGILAMVLA
jgi:hypothetical protein